MLGGQIQFAYVHGSASGAPYVELARIGPHVKLRSQDSSSP